MPAFEPIAIIGEGCVLPGALSPQALWQQVVSGKDLTSRATQSMWGLDPETLIVTPAQNSADKTWSINGGFVTDDLPQTKDLDYCLDADVISRFDKGLQWCLFAARQALLSAGLEPFRQARTDVGVILGNLSYTSKSTNDLAAYWLFKKTVEQHNKTAKALDFDRLMQTIGLSKPDYLHRFSSGAPAHLTAQAIGAQGTSFCLDAACASSLYALKLACDQLHDRHANLMLAGAFNSTDSLYLNVGFTALKALSKHGVSRPFDQRADGLVPAEGAGIIVLKRLDDAINDGNNFLGVIRGIGLSNDGRSGGFLLPSHHGQVRAMQAAYQQSTIKPEEVSYIECHATGTVAGDSTELNSIKAVFNNTDFKNTGSRQTPITLASLKSNLGHLITASGVAGVIRLLASMRHEKFTPTINVEQAIEGLSDDAVHLSTQTAPWQSEKPRIAGINAFGFGGNNAHMIVEQFDQSTTATVLISRKKVEKKTETDVNPIVICGLALQTALCDNVDEFVDLLSRHEKLTQTNSDSTIDKLAVSLKYLGFPPKDLDQTLGQQLIMMELIRQLTHKTKYIDRQNTGIYIGMGVDLGCCRYPARTRLDHWVEVWRNAGIDLDDEVAEILKNSFAPPIDASGVIGTMPNIPANRSNLQLDISGPSFTLSAEELSGSHALKIAQRALAAGEINGAIVGAVDLSSEWVTRQLLQQELPRTHNNITDAGVVLLLKRQQDAIRDGDTIYACLEQPNSIDSSRNNYESALTSDDITARIGYAHAASGLLTVAAGALALRYGLSAAPLKTDSQKINKAVCFMPYLTDSYNNVAAPRSVTLSTVASSLITPATSATASQHNKGDVIVDIGLREYVGKKVQAISPLSCKVRCYRYSGNDFQTLKAAINDNIFSSGSNDSSDASNSSEDKNADKGKLRLCLFAESEDIFNSRKTAALAAVKDLSENQLSKVNSQAVACLGTGIYFSQQRLEGNVAFVFTGAGSAYAGMGKELLAHFPHSVAKTISKFPVLKKSQAWLHPGMPAPDTPFAVLQGCSLLSQIHAHITQHELGITPQAMLGVSSGETNSMFASGAWDDMTEMFTEIETTGMYSTWISGEFKAAKHFFKDNAIADWRMYRVLGSLEKIKAWLALQKKSSQERIFLTMINTDSDMVIAGDAQFIKQKLTEINTLVDALIPIGQDIIAHCPVLSSWKKTWYNIHNRQTTVPKNIRFYSNARQGAYTLSRESAADVLTEQAVNPVDFRTVVNAAYDDGVRIFIEHGPRQLSSQWVSDNLGERKHLSVHLDRVGAGVEPFFEALAQLWCAGVTVDWCKIDNLSREYLIKKDNTYRRLPLHNSDVIWPSLSELDRDKKCSQGNADVMPKAPLLPPVVDTFSFVDSEENLSKINFILSQGPKPSYSMPEVSLSQLENPPQLKNNMPKDSRPSQVKPALTTLQRLYADINHSHQAYLHFQQTAMQQLLQVKAGTESFTRNRPSLIRVQPTAPDAAPDVKTAAQYLDNAVKKPVLPTAPEPKFVQAGSQVNKDEVNSKRQAVVFPGPSFSREQLIELAGGKISPILGPLFAQQDQYERQVRMPQPPLLLTDRVLGIDAKPGAMESRGSIWSETDVTENAWYIHHGHMPAGIMIESGQADLLLISWMGADFENQGERVYRLLGCELTYRDRLPAIGDTLRHDIHLDGYAKQGDVRLFFFLSNCQIAGHTHLEVRRGQAGFFTYDELKNSAGVIWDAENETAREDLGLETGPCVTEKTSFNNEELQAFAKGDLVSCFGEKFYPANCHQRTPTIVGGHLTMFDNVLTLDHQGGPWARGYIQAELDVALDHWFFDGHFKNDPCAPGTLMLEGGVQLLSFYLASMGYTLNCDGWRFEPVKNETFQLICRGQLVPGDKKLVYELFVHGLTSSPYPTLRVDLLCTVDGRKAFLGQSMGVELIPGWPLESRQQMLPHSVSNKLSNKVGSEVASKVASETYNNSPFAFDEQSMLACAWGKPSQAFGPFYQQFDGPRRGPRLPGYPYHFISRVISVDSAPRLMKAGASALVEFDIDPAAWFFDENTQATMPFPALLEVGLQPCGWLATYIGGGFSGEEELFFRNLDGKATAYREIHKTDKTLTTKVTNKSVSTMGTLTIVAFDVNTYCADELVYTMDTVFGFFPKEALAEQSGIAFTDDEKNAVVNTQDAHKVFLSNRPPQYFTEGLRLPGPMLNLLDTVNGFWPEGGENQQGRVRSQMTVNSQAWFFKSHFYGDAVQPGSLGLEMMLQTLQFFAIEKKLGHYFTQPRFETVANHIGHDWSYRGQVLPHNKQVICDLHIKAMVQSEHRLELTADASLWVDGIKIYRAGNLGLALIEQSSTTKKNSTIKKSSTAKETALTKLLPQGIVLDTHVDQWINHHCPSYTVPALPFMCMVEYLCAAVKQRIPGKKITGLRDVRAQRWIAFNQTKQVLLPLAVAISASEATAQLSVWDQQKQRYQQAAEARVILNEEYGLAPKAWQPLVQASEVRLPYESGELFHGELFYGLTQLFLSREGASGIVDAAAVGVPQGLLNPGFLDACLHAIPHYDLGQWFDSIPDNMLAYPMLLEVAEFFGEVPLAGLCRVEVRPKGVHTRWQLPCLDLQIIRPDGSVWAYLSLIETLMPKGALGKVNNKQRHRFFIDRVYVEDMGLSSCDNDQRYLSTQSVHASNWLPGTLESLYGIPYQAAVDIEGLTQTILIKEYFSQLLKVHPQYIVTREQGSHSLAFSSLDALTHYSCTVEKQSEDKITLFSITSSSAEQLVHGEIDRFDQVRAYWRNCLGENKAQGSIEEDILLALAQQFVGSLKFMDTRVITPAESDKERAGVLFIANHQVGVESLLFNVIISALRQQKVFALAKQEHSHSWIGRMLNVFFDDADNDPKLMTLIDRDNPAQVSKTMVSAMQCVASGQNSMLVHAAGTRSLSAQDPLKTVSTTLISSAVEVGVSIVPVMFCGGLPPEELTERLEFPIGYTQQHWVFGELISATTLKSLTAVEQKETILSALNGLDNTLSLESNNPTSTPANMAFSQKVSGTIRSENLTETQAVIRECLLNTSFLLSSEGEQLVALLKNKKIMDNKVELGVRLQHIASEVFGYRFK